MSDSDPTPGHVSARLLVPAIRCLRETGIEPEALLAEARIPKEGISDPDVRITGDAIIRFLVLAVERSGDPAFGLHAGQCLHPGDIGLLEYLVRMSVTPGEIVQTLTRYHRLAGNLQPQIERDGDHIVCHLPLPEPESLPPVVEEYNLSFWAKLARAIQNDDLRPVAVMFTHAKTAYADEAERVFGAPVRFECAKNGLVFEPESLATLVTPVDPGLSRAVAERADEALSALDSAKSISDRVCAKIRLRLRGDGVTAESIAKTLGMSPRTLRRRLEGEGTSFQDLRDAVRKERAVEHIRETELAISEIAYLLGFGETSAFHRAFRRWTGKTPAQYRRDLASSG
ncbi:MAG: AraC family transcriptional regulator [Gemmatimonadota bacterium]|nr:AraC family transcriptional regulator [Gemmatimonadota bacterium]